MRVEDEDMIYKGRIDKGRRKGWKDQAGKVRRIKDKRKTSELELELHKQETEQKERKERAS